MSSTSRFTETKVPLLDHAEIWRICDVSTIPGKRENGAVFERFVDLAGSVGLDIRSPIFRFAGRDWHLNLFLHGPDIERPDFGKCFLSSPRFAHNVSAGCSDADNLLSWVVRDAARSPDHQSAGVLQNAAVNPAPRDERASVPP